MGNILTTTTGLCRPQRKAGDLGGAIQNQQLTITFGLRYDQVDHLPRSSGPPI